MFCYRKRRSGLPGTISKERPSPQTSSCRSKENIMKCMKEEMDAYIPDKGFGKK